MSTNPFSDKPKQPAEEALLNPYEAPETKRKKKKVDAKVTSRRSGWWYWGGVACIMFSLCFVIRAIYMSSLRTEYPSPEQLSQRANLMTAITAAPAIAGFALIKRYLA